MKKIVAALFIVSLIAPLSSEAKKKKSRLRQSQDTIAATPASRARLTCVHDGRHMTIKLSGDLSLYRYCQELPETGVKICLVNDRDGWSSKDRPDLCRDYLPDSDRKYVWGPMLSLKKSDHFAFRFLWNGEVRHFGEVGTIDVAGACRRSADSSGTVENFILVKGEAKTKEDQ